MQHFFIHGDLNYRENVQYLRLRTHYALFVFTWRIERLFESWLPCLHPLLFTSISAIGPVSVVSGVGDLLSKPLLPFVGVHQGPRLLNNLLVLTSN